MKLLLALTLISNVWAEENIFTGYLFSINNKIYISKSSVNSKNAKIIEVDLPANKNLCYKNLDRSCPTVDIGYESQENLIFKKTHLLRKEIKIPMH
jgi:hypothetical protein